MDLLNKSVFDIFTTNAESFSDAKRKNSEETSQRLKYLRLKNNGTIRVRVLPLAPVIGPNNEISMPRKGYEYPTKELTLKIKKTSPDNKNNTVYATICNAKLAFPELKEDLIDTYVRVAQERYATDDALIKKLKAGSFEGGLKWDSKRCMYVLDLENRKEGIQILKLSYAQYKDLEERKLSVWEKLCRSNSTAQCPISSIQSAYPVEIIGKTEAKTTYAFNIDILGGVDQLSEDELKTLLDTQRLPEVLYKYHRYHLEATIVYLEQLDDKMGIDIMNSEEIKNVIEQISMILPADDTSHFSLESSATDKEDAGSNGTALDELWNTFDQLEAAQLDDRSESGMELRSRIKDYISAHELDVVVMRSMSNYDILLAIDEALAQNTKTDQTEETNVSADTKAEAMQKHVELPETEDDAEPATLQPQPEEASVPRRTDRSPRARRSITR